MQPQVSPRLPGVHVLKLGSTGPEYSRWRRGLKFALEQKDTWKYCNGALPMPMLKARLVSTIPADETIDAQPSLLEERRSWVRQDREVKLDIFLSLTEEVMQELFDVGPSLPLSNSNAQEILKSLDERFNVFSFSDYHHAFCHFLNLHIDQYTSIEDFNNEFIMVMEDLIDHGHPLSNAQACSSYFSKLRCTQNPGVAKKLEELDALATEPDIYDLMRESPSWPCIRPLATKSSQVFPVSTVSEECPVDSWGHSYNNLPGLSDTSTVSSDASRSRRLSRKATHLQGAATHASINDSKLDPQDLREAIEKLLTTVEAEPSDLKLGAPAMSVCATPDWLNAQEKVAPKTLSISGPLPAATLQAQRKNTESRARSASPRLLSTTSRTLSQASLTVPTMTTRPRTADTSVRSSQHAQRQPRLPMIQPRTPTYPPPSLSDHPAFRDNPFLPKEHAQSDAVSMDAGSGPCPNRNDYLPPHSAPLPIPYPHSLASSNSSSAISLPLQGTSDLSWSYTKNDSEVMQAHSTPPITISTPLQVPDSNITGQQTKGPLQSSSSSFTDMNPLRSRTPDVDDLIPPPPPRRSILRKTSSSLDILKRLSGDSLLESSDEVREREDRKNQDKERKGKGWSIGLNIARFTYSKGVK